MLLIRSNFILGVAVVLYCVQSIVVAQSIEDMRTNGLQFLDVTQAEDGSWTSSQSVGITGLVVTSMIESGRGVDDPRVEKSLAFIVSKQQPDGGIHVPDSRFRNYETCIAVLALAEANKDGRYEGAIKKAEANLRGMIWDESKGLESSDAAYGGGGYDSKQRPDLSNTQFLIEALKASGVAANDPAMQKALVFVSRCQNLESTHNQLAFTGKVNDGGFIYTPVNGGDSKAGMTKNGGLKSYGLMTYAGMKSMIYAGLSKDDTRVKAATDWIRKNYTLDENPHLGKQGLYYFYHTFGKTMSLLNEDEFVDSKGIKHEWRKELSEKLAVLQQANGSWNNEADR